MVFAISENFSFFEAEICLSLTCAHNFPPPNDGSSAHKNHNFLSPHFSRHAPTIFSYKSPKASTAFGLPEPYPLSCSPWYHTTPRAAIPAIGATFAFQCLIGTSWFLYGV